MKLLFIILFSCFTITAFSQGAASLCWRSDQRGDTTCHQQQFDSLVKVYTQKLTSHAPMNSQEYIMAVKLSNTIFFNVSRICRFSANESYQALSVATSGRYFFDQLTEYLGVCIPNRGMGCYYRTYQLDWGGGAPNDKSLIKVIP